MISTKAHVNMVSFLWHFSVEEQGNVRNDDNYSPESVESSSSAVISQKYVRIIANQLAVQLFTRLQYKKRA